MRTFLVTLVALLPIAAAPSGADAEIGLTGFVPLSYTYKVSWKPKSRHLHGRGRVRIENRSTVPKRLVWIRLRPNGGGRPERIAPRAARIDREAAGGSMVRVRLDHRILPGESRELAFDLTLRVGTGDTSLGRSAGADLFGDALPVVAVAGPRGVRIGSEPDYGEGSLNPVADWNVAVKVPHGMKAILPGSPIAIRDFAFAIGRFKCEQDSLRGVTFAACGVDVSRNALRSALRRAEQAWSTLQGWYGGYDLHSLKVIVGDLPFGGSEYPGLVFSTPDNATIAHEVAHQWFYGLVGNDQYTDPFLDESLTAYTEQQFHHSYHCNVSAPIRNPRRGLGTGMGYWQHHPKAYEDTIYRGGACALTALRRDIGDAAFQSALREYVRANANKIADVNDFLSAVRAAAPGYDLARWQRLVGLE